MFLEALLLFAQAAADPSLKLNKDTWHPLVEQMKPGAVRATDDQLAKIKTLPMEAMWGALRDKGYTNCCITGLKTTRPGERLVGRVKTIRALPARPDMAKAASALANAGGWSDRNNVRAAEESQPGDVWVVDMGGLVAEGIFFGDVSALGAKVNGANGFVLWGGTRDKEELEALAGLPVFAVGFDPGVNRTVTTDWNVPVRIGNVAVLPGDIVVGDTEVVMFFPASIAREVIDHATKVVDKENYERELVRQKKHRFRDVYPLNKELNEEYERKRAKP
jgi:regulator of RNase E activity RraA